MKDVRPHSVAGTFYPLDPRILSLDIERMLDDTEKRSLKGIITALIVPHAGYAYSGLTAAHGFKLLEGKRYDTVVVISPSHREYFRGISVFNGTTYRTPLGDVPIDAQLREEIVKGDQIIESSARGHGAEHAIEVQIPFLQKVIKDFMLLPVVVGDQRSDYCFHLGNRLAEVLENKNALIVASTDLSHFHPSAQAQKLDQIIISDVENFDYQKLMEDLEFEKAEACGGGPVVAAMSASKQLGADGVEVLHQCNSGDVTGDHESVVGYFSAAITKPK